MFRHHFGLKNEPLGKGTTELWDDGHLTLLKERFQWLLDSPGLGLLTGEPGVGKTAALRHVTATLNPHRFQVIYLAETDFGRIDIYRSLALALGLEPAYRWTAKTSYRSGSSMKPRTSPWSSSGTCQPL